MVVNCISTDGFKVEGNVSDTDCDLPLCFGTQVLTWDNVLYTIISQDNAIPLGEAFAFVKSYVQKEYNCFCSGNSKFHVNLMGFPEQINGIYPKQDGISFEKYLNLVLFHYTIVAFKLDYKPEFD